MDGGTDGRQAHALLMSNWGFTSSTLFSWWIFQVAFWLVLAVLVLLAQWLTTKASNRWCVSQKKASARLLRESEAWKIGAAWSTGLFCVFLLSALLFRRGGESWDTGLALNFVTSQDQNAPCFHSAHPPRLNTNKVINAAISPSSFHDWKTQEEPPGTFVVVFQLPMFTILHLRPFPLRERCWLGCRSANPTWMWHL